LFIVLGIYLIIFLFDKVHFFSSIEFFVKTLIKLIPTLIIIFVIMFLTNYFVKPKTLAKLMGKGSGVVAWIITIASGIISTGPIYMWYPLLSELKNKGVRPALISTFLYNRAVKIPLMPMLILYFGIKYTIILTVVMIVISVVQGLTTEKIVEVLE